MAVLTYFSTVALSYTCRGPSKTFYEFKQGEPLPVHHLADASKFQGMWDVLYECDARGRPTNFAHPDDRRVAEAGQPISYAAMRPPAPAIMSSDVVRRPEPSPEVRNQPAAEPLVIRPRQPAAVVAAGAEEVSAMVLETQAKEQVEKAVAAPPSDLVDDPEIKAMEARQKRAKEEWSNGQGKRRGKR